MNGERVSGAPAATNVGGAVSEDKSGAAELRRIREYYRRRQRDVPARRYSQLSPAYAFQSSELKQQIARLLARKNAIPFAKCRILDVGCGDGRWLRAFVELGAEPRNLAGIDLLPERISAAKESSPRQICLRCGDASRLPFGDGSFDILASLTVFSSILDRGIRESIAAEMMRVLQPDGFILWYDFFVSHPLNRDVRGISSSEIKKLFPRTRINLARVTLAPPISRMIAWNRTLLKTVSGIRLLRTHHFGTIEKQ